MTICKLKRDSAKIYAFLDELKLEPWLGNRKWWADYLFHFTDIKNAVSILNHGQLLSRELAIAKHLLIEDSASAQIVGQTESRLTGHARFYFRPLTPTAYRNEGIRPRETLYQGAHCPVPIYFLFDLRSIACLEDSKFSNGSLARHDHRIFHTAEDFCHLPFEDIYHNSPWGHEEANRQNEIKNRRHAEVIVPERISLSYLKYIVCRSQAEYETLFNLLSSSIWKNWKNRVAVSKNQRLFNNEWLYVKDVTLTLQSVTIRFNSPHNPRYCGPFKVRVDISDNTTSDSFFYEENYLNIVKELSNLQLELDMSNVKSTNYSLRVSIDDNLAYLGRYLGDDIPF